MNSDNRKKLQDAVRELRELYYALIEDSLRSTHKTYKEIGQSFGVSEQTVYTIARLRGLSRMNADGDAQSNGGFLTTNNGEENND